VSQDTTILIIDDNIDIFDAIGTILERSGYSVITASRGKEAIDIFKQTHEKIDLVILDAMMPDTSGHILYPIMKKIAPEIKVLLSTGYDRNEYVQKIMELGCNGFIQKPYSFKSLKNEIEKILSSSG